MYKRVHLRFPPSSGLVMLVIWTGTPMFTQRLMVMREEVDRGAIQA